MPPNRHERRTRTSPPFAAYPRDQFIPAHTRSRCVDLRDPIAHRSHNPGRSITLHRSPLACPKGTEQEPVTDGMAFGVACIEKHEVVARLAERMDRLTLGAHGSVIEAP